MPTICLSLREADGGLPDARMCCGAQATVRESTTLSWSPMPPTMRFFLGFLITYFATARYARLEAPFCAKHKGHWRNRTLLMLATGALLCLFAAGSIVLAIVVQPEKDSVLHNLICASPVLAIPVWLALWLYLGFTAIRAIPITQDELELAGVAEEFIRVVEDEDRKRKERRPT